MKENKTQAGEKFVAFVVILLVAFVLFRFTPLRRLAEKDVLLDLLSKLKGEWWGPLLFILIYGVGCVFALPGSILTLAGGAIFGTFFGTLYNILASNLGATLAFFMARFLGRDFVGGFLKGGKLASFDDKVGEKGFQVIFRLRLIPLVPFNGLNFGAGFSKIRYRDYLFGSMLGMLPATFIYTYFADALLSGVTGASRQAFLNLAIAAVLLIAISFLPALFKPKKPDTGA
jgi:uncharacterized membrane protein YdjX (TVP38/TMEM64 family)